MSGDSTFFTKFVYNCYNIIQSSIPFSAYTIYIGTVLSAASLLLFFDTRFIFLCSNLKSKFLEGFLTINFLISRNSIIFCEPFWDTKCDKIEQNWLSSYPAELWWLRKVWNFQRRASDRHLYERIGQYYEHFNELYWP